MQYEYVGATHVGFVRDSALSAFAMGRTTAIVLDLAHDGTRATAVVEGYAESKVSTSDSSSCTFSQKSLRL